MIVFVFIAFAIMLLVAMLPIFVVAHELAEKERIGRRIGSGEVQ